MKPNRYLFIHSFVSLLSRDCTVKEALELLEGGDNDAGISRLAGFILLNLQKGRHMAEIFESESILPGVRYRPYIEMFVRTGNIHASLTLILEDLKRRRDNRGMLLQAVLYPACVTGCMAALLALLFAAGIPWIRRSGLPQNDEALQGMKNGILLAAGFLASSTGCFALFSYLLLGKKNAEYAFWSSLESLGEAGLTFEQALDSCANTAHLPRKPAPAGSFLDSAGHDLFTRSALRSLLLTGDFRETFRTVAAYKKERLTSLYAVFGKTAEPVLLAIVGVVILIVSLTVFLPLVSQNGGFL